MPKNWRAAVPEDEFISLCRQGTSVRQMAEIVGVSERKISERKARLRAKDIQLTPVQNPEYRAIRSITLTDGVVLVGGDAHYWPEHVPTMHHALLYLCERLQPAVVVANGDFFDGSSISRFPSIAWEKNPTVKQELEVVQDRMDEIFKRSRNAQHFWTAGNHDMRFESRLAASAPEYRGVQGMHLKDHIQGWTPCWAVEINRETPSWTEIRHREKGGIHAGYRNTIEAGVSIVTGHDHRADVTPFTDRRGTRYGVRHGMMAETPLEPQFRDYLEARRVNWQSGLAVLTYRDGKLMQPELCLRHERGIVEFRGELIRVGEPDLSDYESEQSVKAKRRGRK